MILRNCSFGDKSVQNHGLEKEIARAVTTDPFGCCSFDKPWYQETVVLETRDVQNNGLEKKRSGGLQF